MTILQSLQECKDRVAAAQAAVDAAKAKLDSAKLELKQSRVTAARAKSTEVKAVLARFKYWTHEVSVYCNDIYVSTSQVPPEALADWRLCDTRQDGHVVYTTFRNGSGIIVCNTYDPRLPV